jgi:cytochrome c oxidase subunit I
VSAAPPAAADTAAAAIPAEALPSGPLSWVASADHKVTALRIASVALIFFIASGLLALVMRTELAQPGLQVVSEGTYNELFTMHGSGMIYLVITPLALALGLYFVPLQVGAAEIWSPRLALSGFWIFVAGGLTMYSGFLTAQGSGRAGWAPTYPLAGDHWTPGIGMDMWVLGVILAVLGMFLVGICVLATALRERAPGMTLLRMPPFTWAMVATCLMVITSFPVLIGAMVLLEWDRHVSPVFDSTGGPALFQHLFWFYGHPVVYVMFFPFVGAVAEVVSTFSRRRFFGYSLFVISMLLFAALSMSVWAHHMFTTGQVTNQYYSLTSHALIIPAGIEYFDLIATMIGGAILFRTPMLFAIGFILQFLIGGLTGIIVASPPIDYHVHDSFFIVGHFHYTLFAGSVFGLFAATYYWFPKVTGVTLREGLGKLHFWLLVIGTNLTFFPMFFLGFEGMQRRIGNYPASSGFGDLNLVSTIGAFVIALAIAVFLVNLWVSLRRREPAGADPWEGQSLEWATSSPPPRFNFRGRLPQVTSFAPLLDRRERDTRGRASATRTVGPEEEVS